MYSVSQWEQCVNYAHDYGYDYDFIPSRSKRARHKWQDRPRHEDVERAIAENQGKNIIAKWGRRSGNLVDFDLDDKRAATVAEMLMPRTDATYGRAGKRRSHRIYRVDGTCKTTQFKDPVDKAMLVELRGEGAYSVLPGSEHESGERIEWEGEPGTPADLSLADAEALVAEVAAATLLAKYYPEEGARHLPTLSLAGWLSRQKGWEDEERAVAFVRAIATVAGDPNVFDRANEVRSTYSRHAQGDTDITGYPSLLEYYDKGVLNQVGKWLGFTQGKAKTGPIEARDNRLYLVADDGARTQIANFVPRVAADEWLDEGNGEQQEKRVAIELTLRNGRIVRCSIPASEFADMKKLHGVLQAAGGAGLRIEEGCVPLVRRFMQEGMGDVAERVTYCHTGWDDEGRFLAPSGGVGADGVPMEIPHQLHRYGVREVAPDDLREAARVWVDDFLHVFPSRANYLYAATLFLAPVHGLLPTSQRYVTHFLGETGTKKTSNACAGLSLYGDFSQQPPESWQSTANSLEKTGYVLKDLPLLVDDLKRATVRQYGAVQIIQRYADGTGRGRLSADIRQISQKPMRGQFISTGEDTITEEASVQARMITLTLARGECDEGKLSSVQRVAHLLPGLGYAYLAWLRKERNGKVAHWVSHYEGYRNSFLAALRKASKGATNDARVASNFAQNTVGFTLMIAFLLDNGLLNRKKAFDLLKGYGKARRELMRKTVGAVTEEKASVVFLHTLQTLLATEQVRIEALTTASQVERTFDGADTPNNPYATLVGWRDDEHVYLSAKAYEAVFTGLQRSGKQFPFSEKAVYAQLDADGYMIERGEEGRSMKMKSIGKKKVRVLWLRPDVFEA